MNRCPYCNRLSKGETEIVRILDKLGIRYYNNHKFDDCKHILHLKFDFYLPDYNMVIEYDGIQHFKPVKKFGGVERFKLDKYRDSLKNKYCEDNNIKMLRIAYFDYRRIEQILINSTTIETTLIN